MKRLYEFKCTECGNVFEEYTEYKQKTVSTCCEKEADKIISTPRVSLEGVTGDFPGAALAWEKKRREHQAKERKLAEA